MFKDEKDILRVVINDKEVAIEQIIYVRSEPSHCSTLCICDNYKDAYEYIINLDMNNLPPNGRR